MGNCRSKSASEVNKNLMKTTEILEDLEIGILFVIYLEQSHFHFILLMATGCFSDY